MYIYAFSFTIHEEVHVIFLQPALDKMNEQTNGKPPTENRATALVVVSEEIIYDCTVYTTSGQKNKKFYIIP